MGAGAGGLSAAGALYDFFTRCAPHLASSIAPLLLAAGARRGVHRRVRAISGLLYAPTGEALDRLVSLLDDPSERVANQAGFSLTLLAAPAGGTRRTPSAPDDVAPRLIDALASGSPAMQRRALDALAWFAGIQHRRQITLPAYFTRVLPAIARLLVSPDPQVQQRAVKRVNAAGYHLDMLRPSRVTVLTPALRLPPLDLQPLLDHSGREVVRSALYLAGRCGMADTPPDQDQLATQILSRLDLLRNDVFAYPAALYALGRLQATAAIP